MVSNAWDRLANRNRIAGFIDANLCGAPMLPGTWMWASSPSSGWVLPTHTVQRLPAKGASTRTQWTDLDGAVNDATEMKALLMGRFGFREKDIIFLSNF